MLQIQRDRLYQKLLTDISAAVDAVSVYYNEDKDHYEENHGDEYDRDEPEEQVKIYGGCFRRHQALMKCHRELVRKDVWRTEGQRQTLWRLIEDISGLRRLKDAEESSGKCDIA